MIFRRRRLTALDLMGRATLGVIADLERAGCRITAARVLPMAAVHIDRPPAGLDTWGHIQPPPRAVPGPVEHVAHLRGVRITWFATPGGRHA